MDLIHESSSQLEFSSDLSWAARALVLIGGVLPLLAPYELLIRPSWRGDVTSIWWLVLLISAGAVGVSLLAIYFALFGLAQRIRFDSYRRVVTYGFKAAVLRYREKRYPFSAIETLEVRTHEWTDGPATHNLVLKLKGAREIEFGRFTDQAEAERYFSALDRMIKRGGTG
jgi:hypothetical protein